jgi:integrase
MGRMLRAMTVPSSWNEIGPPHFPAASVLGTRSASDRVDPRVLVNKVQASQLFTAVSYIGTWNRMKGRRLVAFYAVMYFAAVRPSEAVGLKKDDCYLPESGWGALTLRDTHPVSGKKWTDSGKRHDKRGLKSREVKEDRPVPIPPPLVRMLLDHIEEFGTAQDGRLFTNERGELEGSSTYWRVWRDAREYGLPPRSFKPPFSVGAPTTFATRASQRG